MFIEGWVWLINLRNSEEYKIIQFSIGYFLVIPIFYCFYINFVLELTDTYLYMIINRVIFTQKKAQHINAGLS